MKFEYMMCCRICQTPSISDGVATNFLCCIHYALHDDIHINSQLLRPLHTFYRALICAVIWNPYNIAKPSKKLVLPFACVSFLPAKITDPSWPRMRKPTPTLPFGQTAMPLFILSLSTWGSLSKYLAFRADQISHAKYDSMDTYSDGYLSILDQSQTTLWRINSPYFLCYTWLCREVIYIWSTIFAFSPHEQSNSWKYCISSPNLLPACTDIKFEGE